MKWQVKECPKCRKRPFPDEVIDDLWKDIMEELEKNDRNY